MWLVNKQNWTDIDAKHKKDLLVLKENYKYFNV